MLVPVQFCCTRERRGSVWNMKRIEKTVFLSYRRTNAYGAIAIFQNLNHHDYDVFIDYNGIASGDFERIILENIKARAHFLVLLTPSALERCNEPADWLRREIETALANQRNIVPLMLEGFDFGAPTIASQLTGPLAALKQYNALRIPPDYFDAAMERLRTTFLDVPLTAVLHPVSLSAQQAAIEQKAAAGVAPTIQEKELTAQQWFERGFASADLDEQMQSYDQAIVLKPDYVLALNNRGNARKDKGDLDAALQDLNEVVRLKPDFAEGFYNRGIVHQIKGDLDAAMKDYDEAIRLNPDIVLAFINRSNTRQAKGDLGGALEGYNELIRLKPTLAEAFHNRSNVHQSRGDLDAAIKDYSEAIRLNPGDFTETFYGRGNARLAKRDLDAAIEDYGEAIRLNPGFAQAFNSRGVARAARGDLDAAIEDYNEAIRLNPSYAIAYYNRSRARDVKGDPDGAMKDYNEAIRLGYKPKI
jgi:tetratricopeptide (TPR) repeat protein